MKKSSRKAVPLIYTKQNSAACLQKSPWSTPPLFAKSSGQIQGLLADIDVGAGREKRVRWTTA